MTKVGYRGFEAVKEADGHGWKVRRKDADTYIASGFVDLGEARREIDYLIREKPQYLERAQ